jgi:plastocyanin
MTLARERVAARLKAKCEKKRADSAAAPVSEQSAGGASVQSPLSSGAIVAQDFKFVPAGLCVRKGAAVTFSVAPSRDCASHRIVVLGLRQGPVASPELAAGMSHTVRFDEVGDFEFYCSNYSFLSGRVSVAEPDPEPVGDPAALESLLRLLDSEASKASSRSRRDKRRGSGAGAAAPAASGVAAATSSSGSSSSSGVSTSRPSTGDPSSSSTGSIGPVGVVVGRSSSSGGGGVVGGISGSGVGGTCGVCISSSGSSGSSSSSSSSSRSGVQSSAATMSTGGASARKRRVLACSGASTSGVSSAGSAASPAVAGATMSCSGSVSDDPYALGRLCEFMPEAELSPKGGVAGDGDGDGDALGSWADAAAEDEEAATAAAGAAEVEQRLARLEGSAPELGGLAVGLAAPAPLATRRRLDVLVTAYKMTPKDLAVQAGEVVRWSVDPDCDTRFALEGAYADGRRAFSSGLLVPGSSYERVFRSAGAVQYGCTIYPWMKGSVAVAPPPPGAALEEEADEDEAAAATAAAAAAAAAAAVAAAAAAAAATAAAAAAAAAATAAGTATAAPAAAPPAATADEEEAGKASATHETSSLLSADLELEEPEEPEAHAQADDEAAWTAALQRNTDDDASEGWVDARLSRRNRRQQSKAIANRLRQQSKAAAAEQAAAQAAAKVAAQATAQAERAAKAKARAHADKAAAQRSRRRDDADLDQSSKRDSPQLKAPSPPPPPLAARALSPPPPVVARAPSPPAALTPRTDVFDSLDASRFLRQRWFQAIDSAVEAQ